VVIFTSRSPIGEDATRRLFSERLAMEVPLLVIAAAAAAQSPLPPPADLGPGRPFMSPMGEPVFGRTPNEEGLTAWFARADSNHDGVLTLDEMTVDAERFFKMLDHNHDGEIDPDEISYYEEVIAPEVHGRAIAAASATTAAGSREGARSQRRLGGFTGFGGRDDEAGAGRYGLLQIPEPVSSADSDFNRGVSEQEFKSAAIKRFQLLDADRTGRLTLPELESIHRAAVSAANQPRKDRQSDSEGQLDPNADTGGDPPM
jgi:Ca2+-binding EF-hand superfamily protein